MKITSDFLNSIKDTLTERTDRENKVAEIISEALTEHAEELDEISKKTLGSYIKKSKDDIRLNDKLYNSTGYKEYAKTNKNRVKGINKAVDKLTKESEEDIDFDLEILENLLQKYGLTVVKEDAFEELDEISKKTLGAYIGRSLNGVRNSNQALVRWKETPAHPSNPYDKDDMIKLHDRKAANREKGIRQATNRLTKD